jgi:hypothetical protein
MTKGLPLALAALFAAALPALDAHAQVKERWHLKYEQGHPQIYTHRDKAVGPVTYWYFTYSVTNPTDERVPILVDIQLYVETGRGMQTDVEKTKIETVSAVFDYRKGDPWKREYESNRFGRFYSNVIAPEAEYAVIEHDLKLGNRIRDRELQHWVNGLLGGNRGIVEESILNFKKKNYYLNPREARIKGHIQPGETIHGIAIFQDVDPRANVIETHVSGLYDIFVLEAATDEENVLSYENRVFIQTYEFRGDAFERTKDQLLPPPKKKWVTKRIGPIASKETMTALVDMFVQYLKQELEWRLQGLTPDEIAAERHRRGIVDADIHGAADVFQRAMAVVEFGYNRDLSPWENRHALWRIHEFWLTNKSRIRFNFAANRYEVFEEALPGREDYRRDH